MTRGELWWADFGLPFGSETGFRRPVLIIQDDSFNRSAIGTVIVIPLTTNLALGDAPGNVHIGQEESGLSKDSVLVVSQVSAIDKHRLIERISAIETRTIHEVEYGISMILGFL